jgi:hypothetical protein
MTNQLEPKENQLSIEKIEGKTKIVFNKAKITGSASQKDLMDLVLVAANMQAQKLIEKLSRGAPLDRDEIKSLTELANIAKTQIVITTSEKDDGFVNVDTAQVQQLKSDLYKALAAKTKEKP